MIAEGFAAADQVDPAPPRPEIRALGAALQAPARVSRYLDRLKQAR